LRIVVGLGNPGREYGRTRHNLGFDAVEEFSRRMGFAPEREACRSRIARGGISGEAVWVARPQTFMNRSGDAVACLLRLWGGEPKDLLVVCDDAAIDLGTLRVRPSGSDGGHRGLRSVIEAVGTRDFPRLRIGIRTSSVARGDLAEQVLAPFPPGELEAAAEQTTRAAECIHVILERGIQAAMNAYNRRQPNDPRESSAS
jgi:peptidyl-tRNA hydrolase, PTH1 family